MRLLTHNSLKSPVKDVAKGYPMKLEIADMEVCVCVCVCDSACLCLCGCVYLFHIASPLLTLISHAPTLLSHSHTH